MSYGFVTCQPRKYPRRLRTRQGADLSSPTPSRRPNQDFSYNRTLSHFLPWCPLTPAETQPRAACFSFGGRPLRGNLGTSCDRGQIFDEAGLHALTCPTWYITALLSLVTSRSLSLSTNSSIIVGSHARLPNLTFPGRRRVTPAAQVFKLISTSAIRGIQEPITALAARSATFLSRIRAMLQEHTQMEPPRLVAGGTPIDIRRV
jgi:hypothetical protein